MKGKLLQEHKVRLLGSNRAIDIRIFLEDPYYRLNIVSLKLQPLHELAEEYSPAGVVFITPGGAAP
ncbi:hypothetical protein [Sodalis-like endosymbiont of Proechinophthirus fluctus]|uniref:hypothetical protein n=1 Tax=Sodalis-like endosymbiont of Proechinophthirus fluctus TaxID=1462730 RepID=UPI00082CC508